MKKTTLFTLLIFLTFFQFNSLNAQSFNKSLGAHEVVSIFTRVYQSAFKTSKSRYILKGSYHIFPTWKNNGIIRMNGKDYKIYGVNLNVKTDNLEAEMHGDSIFIYDFTKAEFAKINNRIFKSIYFDKEKRHRIVEVIYDSNKFEILKKYEVAIELGRVDPLMVKKKVDKYYLNSKYYLKTDNNFKELTLKKKNIMPLFKDKTNQVSKFIKKNKLSLKKDKDLKKIFKYYDSL